MKIICHMVASIDGRIDCAMVDKISGDEYYTTLEKLDCPSYLNGRITMEHYSASSEKFTPKSSEPIGKTSFFVAKKSSQYAISVDTHGQLMWNSNDIDGVALVCIVSEKASKEYTDYLQEMNISWIATGKERIDLSKAMQILESEFGVKRLAILGGGTINGAFLEAGLIDEVSLLLAPGIDARKGRVALFDGLDNIDRAPFPLTLQSVERIEPGILWIRYTK